jgi:hypothetical protein
MVYLWFTCSLCLEHGVYTCRIQQDGAFKHGPSNAQQHLYGSKATCAKIQATLASCWDGETVCERSTNILKKICNIHNPKKTQFIISNNFIYILCIYICVYVYIHIYICIYIYIQVESSICSKNVHVLNDGGDTLRQSNIRK